LERILEKFEGFINQENRLAKHSLLSPGFTSE